ncbi:MAG: VOC family protein [Anaerolineae bacterium]|nr:VOC family protein [Anaerolineae bacterium]
MNQALIQILGDYADFYAMQAKRLLNMGIDIEGYEVSHLAFRTETLEDYLHVRKNLETVCLANVENTWNGRPISKLLLKEPLQLSQSATTDLIELIPPVHQNIYKMGLEHVGIVIGESFDDFARLHAGKFTGQQDQGPFCQPYYIAFPDHTNVKFYRYSLKKVCVLEGKRFDGFHHEVA